MKRVITLILVVLLVVSMSSCHYSKSGDILEPVDYYYPRKTDAFIYGDAAGVITAEVREASGHIGDLKYLLTMYLRGPQAEGLYSPFPADCTLEEIYIKDDTLYLHFDSKFAKLQSMELTIACASLAKTCLSMTGLPYVCIQATSEEQDVQILLNEDALQFTDFSAFDADNTLE